MKTKQVGDRKASRGLRKVAKFLETVLELRGDRPFIPRGVYRFKTHEKAQAWSLQMMARKREKAVPRR